MKPVLSKLVERIVVPEDSHKSKGKKGPKLGSELRGLTLVSLDSEVSD